MNFKSIILILFTWIFFTPTEAQIAPDFSMTDLDSVKWNLYDELEKGNTVVLDFFFADCKPCQKYTPEMVKVYKDYGADTGKVIVLGISDRDNDEILKTFEQTYSVNYPSCGTEGGGDTITALYSSWFPFFGWPTYAVICPNREVFWNLKIADSLPEVRSALDSCSRTVGISEPEIRPTLYPNPAVDIIRINTSSTVPVTIELYSPTGVLEISRKFMPGNIKEVSLTGLNSGYHIVRVILPEKVY